MRELANGNSRISLSRCFQFRCSDVTDAYTARMFSLLAIFFPWNTGLVSDNEMEHESLALILEE